MLTIAKKLIKKWIGLSEKAKPFKPEEAFMMGILVTLRHFGYDVKNFSDAIEESNLDKERIIRAVDWGTGAEK